MSVDIDVLSERKPSFAERALEQLREWPALRECRTGQPYRIGLAAGSRPIVCLPLPDAAELCLTQPVIERMKPALEDSGLARIAAASDWIRLRLDCDSDVKVLMSLVSVAIKANAQAQPRSGRRRTYRPRFRPVRRRRQDRAGPGG